MAADIFAVPILNKWLLHAPLHRITGLVNRQVIDALQSGEAKDSSGQLSELWAALSSPPIESPQPLSGEIAPDFLGIIPTRGCNIGCVYCNFGGPTAEMTTMDPRIAVAAIDWMAERLAAEGRKKFVIHFFGGEPFVAGEIVDIVVHRARYVAAKLGLVASFDASTNGVFPESRAQFIGDYFDSVVLSFDGFRQYHDRNRPGHQGASTFDAVARTAKRLSLMPLNLCLRVCITQDSVGDVANITRWMCEEYQPAIINFETLTPGPLAASAGLALPDPFEFTKQFVAARRVAREFGIEAIYSAAETKRNRISFCPVGSDTPIVGLEGKMNACYLLEEDWRSRGIEMNFGRVLPNGSVQIDYEALARIRTLPTEKPRCSRCFCQWSCAGGCHVNHTYPGCSLEYDEFCLQTRLITACLLLEEIGREDLVEAIVGDRSALERLANYDWDSITIGEPIYAN